MNKPELRNLLDHALREDLGTGDLSSSIFSAGHSSSGSFVAKAAGIAAGMEIIGTAYSILDPAVRVEIVKDDGTAVEPGDVLAKAAGPTASLLSGERVVLNLLQHLGGIATKTRRAVEALGSPHTKICDTRKTLPGLRMLQKYAVRCGGGYNHRYRLDDGVMIKDNHIVAAGGIANAVALIRKTAGPMVRIEVETESREQVIEAIDAGADIIMFDNRSPGEVKELAALVPAPIITEASGRITLANLPGYRDTGVDYISLGFLTHSVEALDISFNLNSKEE